MADTICALATASGRSALAVVRLSGPDAFTIAREVLGWPAGRTVAPRVATLARIRDSTGGVLDTALVTFFPGPASYSGEDTVEISCHGGLLVPNQILSRVIGAGARLALPGEFTRRAVLSGRLDLIQAEAIGDLIDATSGAQGRAAIHQLEGGLSRRLASLRASLLDLLAMQAYDIDFPEEDDGPISRAQIDQGLTEVGAQVGRLLRTAATGIRLQHGALVVLAGRPNAGKSSLFNALLGIERAIVTELPGTTRDAVEAPLEIDGWPLRLVDTAGLRPSEDRIERLGIEVSHRYLDQADLVLLCHESGGPLNDQEREIANRPETLLVFTKSDLGPAGPADELSVSVVNGSGLDRLRGQLRDRCFSPEVVDSAEPLLTRERHRLGLERAAEGIDAARRLLAARGEAVLVAHEVQRAVAGLEEVLGVVDLDEVLGKLFQRFCVGK